MVSEVFYQNANNNYQSVVNDYSVVKNRVCKDNEDKSDAPIFCALKTIAPVRRAISVKDEAQQGNLIPALGIGALFLTYLKEDMRDIKEAGKQIGCWWKGEKYISKYGVENYKDYQHAFSSVRGTGWIEDLIKRGLEKGNKWANIIKNLDVALSKTKTGGTLLSKLCKDIDYKNGDVIQTGIESIISTKEKPTFINAFNFKGKGKIPIFGELTARAMTRTTKLGLLVLAAIEAPKIIKSMTQGETITEQANSTAKQTVNSAVKISSLASGIAYGGALGHKLGGPTGSLIGMGTGAILGSTISNKFKELTT